MRNCDGCQACCQGFLIGSVNDKPFGNMVPCSYLGSECSIYEDRPQMCRDYYCAWAQELLPEFAKPSECGVVVSVEIDKEGRQYLKAVHKDSLREDVRVALDDFTRKNNSYFTTVKVIPIGRPLWQ